MKFPIRHFRAFFVALVMLFVAQPVGGRAETAGAHGCWVREGKNPIINKPDTIYYERKLFVSSDEVGRFVFLTNSPYIGDRSAAIYRAGARTGSLPGNYWVTATVASESLSIDKRNIRIRRFDAPLPTSVADMVHELFLRVVQQSAVESEALPSAPTGILHVVTPKGVRLKAVTASLAEENSFCMAVLNLGESLVQYSRMPVSKRSRAAKAIERECRRLLRRLTQNG